MAKRPADIHMHSKLCGHARGELEEYVESGLRRGVEAVGFSFHLPVDVPFEGKVNVTREELDVLAGEVERLQQAYRDEIPIRFGGEADYLPGSEAEIAALLDAYPFDHVIGSVHFIDDWAFDSPRSIGQYDAWDLHELYATYFGLVQRAMRTGLYDIVGHVDLIKKFGHRPDGDWSGLVEQVCVTAAECGLCIEINTAGIDKPVGEHYAPEPIVRRCLDLGVPICFGSDAHAPEEVARYFDRAVALAREVGFTAYATFQRRRRALAPIPFP